MGELIGWAIGLAVLGATVYSTLGPMLQRRYPRTPPRSDDPTGPRDR